MAVVFISYERSAEATSRRVGAALEQSGYEVWSDADLPPHRDYAKVIEEHLTSADVVLVLWSQAAAESQWVRAEADFGRERRKLVQATLDGSVPPMPFNQIHCASLAAWRGGDGDRQWAKVLASIEHVSASPGVPPAPVASQSTGSGRAVRMGRLAWVGVALAVTASLATGAWLFRGAFFSGPPFNPARVAILPFETLSSSADTKFFADGLADQIVTTLNNNHFEVLSRDDAATLRGADRAAQIEKLGVGLVLDGAVQSDGANIKASVHLDDPRKRVTLWSGGEEGPANQATQIQARLASSIVFVLACSKRALTSAHGLTDPALLTRYLHACDVMGNQHTGDLREPLEMVTALRLVTAGAPDFEPALSDLALYGAAVSIEFPPDQAAALRKEAASDAARALALNPKSADAYVAQAILLPASQRIQIEALIRRGVAADPDWPDPYNVLAGFLGNVGRVHEAALAAEKGASLDLHLDGSVAASAYAGLDGQAQRCVDELTQANKLMPKDEGVWNNLFSCLQTTGRWDEAAALASDAANRPIGSGASNPVEVAYLKAAKTRAPGDMAKARALLAPLPGEPNYILTARLQGLSELGFVDDAFSVADKMLAAGERGGDWLFNPRTAPMRRDPRFILLVARMGLVDYWRASGHWPDFCSDPKLPYNCQTEAAKLATNAPSKSKS